MVISFVVIVDHELLLPLTCSCSRLGSEGVKEWKSGDSRLTRFPDRASSSNMSQSTSLSNHNATHRQSQRLKDRQNSIKVDQTTLTLLCHHNFSFNDKLNSNNTVIYPYYQLSIDKSNFLFFQVMSPNPRTNFIESNQ